MHSPSCCIFVSFRYIVVFFFKSITVKEKKKSHIKDSEQYAEAALKTGKYRQTCKTKPQVDENADCSPFAAQAQKAQRNGKGLQGKPYCSHGNRDPGADCDKGGKNGGVCHVFYLHPITPPVRL